MHKVDSAGATVDNRFTNGDLPNGIARTRLESKFMNAVMDELASAVVQAGLTLSDTDNAQVLQSVALTVATVAALRACPVPTVANGKNVSVFVRGSAADGDGGAAFYRWVYNSSTADDGVSCVRPSTNPAQGRWLRCLDGYASDSAKLGGVLAANYALLASPALTGTPTAPTAAAGTNTTQLATTAYVRTAITALINSSPAALDTLAELAAALGNDSNYATTITNALALKAPLASPALTGTPTGPTPGGGDNSTRLATTAFVVSLLAAKAALDSPAFTGTPTAPTPGGGDNSTRIATTAFMQSALSAFGNQSLTAAGFQSLPGGFEIQWGNGSVGAGETFVTFPDAFSNACLCVIAGLGYPGGIPGNPGVATRPDWTASGFALGSGGSLSYRYIAIGY